MLRIGNNMADIIDGAPKGPAPKGFSLGEVFFGSESEVPPTLLPPPRIVTPPNQDYLPGMTQRSSLAEPENVPPPLSPPPNRVRERFMAIPAVVEIPCEAPEFAFCGSLHVEVDHNHEVLLLLLTADFDGGGANLIVQKQGLRTCTGSVSPAMKQRLATIVDAGVRLQGDLSTAGPWAKKLCTFLSSESVRVLVPHPRIEIAKSAGGDVIGFYQGDMLIQFVSTVVVVNRGSVGYYLDARFPYLRKQGVEVYFLPDTADFTEFCSYLAHKNKVGWRGARIRASRDCHAEQRAVIAKAVTRGGVVAAAYAFAAMLLGAIAPAMLPALALGAWGALAAGGVISCIAWTKARKVARRLHLELVEHVSWRLANFAKDQVNAFARELGGEDARQFLAELNPAEMVNGAINVMHAGVLGDNRDAQSVLAIAASAALEASSAAPDLVSVVQALKTAHSMWCQGDFEDATRLILSSTRSALQSPVPRNLAVPPAPNLQFLFAEAYTHSSLVVQSDEIAALVHLEEHEVAGDTPSRADVETGLHVATQLAGILKQTRKLKTATVLTKEKSPIHGSGTKKTLSIGENFDDDFD